MTSDTSGNVYPTSNQSVIFKVAPDGTLVWQRNVRQPGSPSSTPVTSYSVASLNTGFIAIAGSPSGGTISTGGFLVLLDTNGNLSSTKRFIVSASGSLSALTATSSGSLYTSGVFVASATDLFKVYSNSVTTKKRYSNASYNLSFIGSGASDTAYLGAQSSGGPVSIAKADSNLSFLWKVVTASAYFSRVVESNGFAYATAYYGGASALVVKIDANTGSLVWASALTGFPLSVAVDSSDNVYVGGFYGTSKVGIIFKVNPNGTLAWQRSVSIAGLPSYDSTRVLNIAVNNTNNTVCIQVSPEYNSTAYSILLSVPTDGTLTGTYTAGGTSVTYGVYSGTFSSPSITFGLASASLGTSTATDSAVTLTTTTPTNTYNKVSIP